MIQNIGERLRFLRKEKGITLTELSGLSGLSISFISNLERDLCSPTIENLQKLCSALGTPLVQVLEGKIWETSVIRAEERETLYKLEGQLRYESLNFGAGKLDGLIITMEPHCVYEKNWTHSYDEIGLILEGELTMDLEGKTYVLKEGDSFYVKAMSQHNLSNYSDKPCRSYWVKQMTEDHI